MSDSLFAASAFRPPWPLRNRHVQIVLGHLLSGPAFRSPTVKRLVQVSGGDRIVLHDSTPAGWQSGGRIAVLVHGLGGSHDSGHLRRLARLLAPRGVRTVCVDLRGCGDGLAIAHIRTIPAVPTTSAPSSTKYIRGVPVATAAGRRLPGANTVLKLTGEAASEPVLGLERVVALGPPADLRRCSVLMEQRRNRFYNRYFAGILVANALKRRHYFPDLPRIAFPRKTTLRRFRRSVHGAAGRLRRCRRLLHPGVLGPTDSGHSRADPDPDGADDPFIAVQPLEELQLPSAVQLCIVDRGGHLGFLGSDGNGGMRGPSTPRRMAAVLNRPRRNAHLAGLL